MPTGLLLNFKMSVLTLEAKLERTGGSTPWGFRLGGGKDFSSPLTIQKVSWKLDLFYVIFVPSGRSSMRPGIVVNVVDNTKFTSWNCYGPPSMSCKVFKLTCSFLPWQYYRVYRHRDPTCLLSFVLTNNKLSVINKINACVYSSTVSLLMINSTYYI